MAYRASNSGAVSERIPMFHYPQRANPAFHRTLRDKAAQRRSINSLDRSTTMQLYAKKVSAIASGDYYQVHLASDDSVDKLLNSFELPAPYLIVQSQFEFFDGGKCYIESDDDEFIGHFKLKLVEFSPTRLAFEIARRNHNHVEVHFALTAVEFEESLPIIEVIFGMREPDYNAQDFGGTL